MLLQPITVPFSKSTLKPSVYTLKLNHRLVPFYPHYNNNLIWKTAMTSKLDQF